MASSTIARYARALNDIQLVLQHDSDKLSQWDRDLLESVAELIQNDKYPSERQMSVVHAILKDVMRQALQGYHYVLHEGVPIIVAPDDKLH